MFKFLCFILILGAFAFGFSHLAETKGALSLNFNQTLYEVSLPIALFALIALLLALFVAIALVKMIIRSPKAALHLSRERKHRKGYEALTQGLLSISAGDYVAAAKNAREAKKFAPNDPLTLLLTAQASQLTQDRQGAETAFRAMLEAPATRLIGLRGLFLEAERKNETEHARQISEDAIKINPSTPWAAQALLKLEVKAKDYDAAMQTIERTLTARLIDKNEARRLRAVLLTAKGSLENAQEAISYAPDLIPAVVIAMLGLDSKKAAKLAENTWRKFPHPEIAVAYKNLFATESANERLKKCESLASFNSEHLESALLVAKAASEASQFSRAREALKPHLETATPRLCLLMAELETLESSNYGLAREWTQKALRATPDMAWLCDGTAQEKWLPASPLTGEIDAFKWGRPVTSHLPLIIEMPQAPEAVKEEIEPLALPAPKPPEMWQETVFALNQLPDDPGPKNTSKKRFGFF